MNQLKYEAFLVRSRLSLNAMRTIEAAGVDDAIIASDLGALRGRDMTPEKLLEVCTIGAEGVETIKGWAEYVTVIRDIAEGTQ